MAQQALDEVGEAARSRAVHDVLEGGALGGGEAEMDSLASAAARSPPAGAWRQR